MSNDSCILANQGSQPESIMTEMDYSYLQEPVESILTWESAWIDIGGEG